MHSLCKAILYACSLIRICIGSIVFTYVQTQTVYVDTYLHTGPHSSHTLCTIYNPCVHIYTVCVQTSILCVHTASPMKYMFRPCPCYVHVLYSHDVRKSPSTAVQSSHRRKAFTSPRVDHPRLEGLTCSLKG